MMINHSKWITGALSLLLATGNLAYSQQEAHEPAVKKETEENRTRGSETDSEYEGLEVIVWANRMNQSQVDSEWMEVKQAQDLADIFETVPQLTVGGGGNTSTQKLYLRGIEDTRANVQVDGAQLNGNMFHHQGRLTVEPELLKSVEVSGGPGSALHGPGALAGSILFETKDARDLLRPEQDWGGLVKTAYFSNGGGFLTSGATYGNLTKDISALAYISYRNEDAYEDGYGQLVPDTGYQQPSGLFKLNGDYESGITHEVSYEHTETSTEGPQRLNFIGFLGGPGNTNPYDYDFVRDTVTARIGYNPQDEDWLDFETRFFYTDQVFRRRNIATSRESGSGVYTVGYDIRNTSILDSHSITYGTDFHHDTGYLVNRSGQINSAANSVVINGSDETAYVFGFFAQDEWSITESLSASYGIRLDRYHYSDYLDQDFSSIGISPNAGLTYQVTSAFSANLLYSMVHRGVGMPELFLTGDPRENGGGPTVANQSAIDPEEAENLQLTLLYDDGTFLAGGSVYRQTIDDYIPAFGGARGNAGDVRIHGYDAMVGLRWEGLTSRFSVAQADPQVNGMRMGDVIGLGTKTGRKWQADIDYTYDAWNLSAGWLVSYTEAVPGTPNAFGGAVADKEAYALNSTYIQWKPMGPDRLTLTFSVDNVFDEHYVDQSSFGTANASALGRLAFPEPGREFKISATYMF